VRGRRGGLGFGGAVGLGVALSLLIAVIAIGRAVARQLTEAVSVVIVFAEIAVCAILAAVALGVLGLLAYRGQLARLHLAERRITLEQLANGQAVRAEVLEGGAVSVQAPTRPAIQGEQPGTVLASITRLPIAERGETEW
jgi:hypothetical protein